MTNRYIELVERLEGSVNCDHFASELWAIRYFEERKDAAEAIRSLLSLVGEMAEAMEPVSKAFNQVEFKENSQCDSETWIPIGAQLGALTKIEYALQKAREATGEAEDGVV